MSIFGSVLNSVTLVKTEDIPFLPAFSSPSQPKVDVDDLNRQIHSLTSFLLEGMTEDGTYWLVKEEGNPVVRLINLAAATRNSTVGNWRSTRDQSESHANLSDSADNALGKSPDKTVTHSSETADETPAHASSAKSELDKSSLQEMNWKCVLL